MNLCYKQYEQINDPATHQTFYYVPETSFFIDERNSLTPYCEEYGIIQKIRKNEEHIFDFSKNLIDIGSEDGNYAMLLDFAHNHCFEPNKRACCLLYANMFLKNKVDNTDVYNVALDYECGHVEFDGFNSLNESNKNDDLYYPDSETYKDKKIYKVPAIKLDLYGFKNVGLIKIDVEGFEERVLRGAINTIIDNNYPPILFECWDVGQYGMTQEKHDSLFNFIRAFGYTILEYWGDHETHLAIKK